MIEKIKKALKKIDNDKMYDTDAIQKMAIVLDTSLKPSRFTLYRMIRNGKISSVDMGTGKQARHFVKGSELKRYIKTTYKI